MKKIILFTPCTTPPPRMYIPLSTSINMRRIFEDEKHPHLVELIGKNETREIDFSTKDFSDLLKRIIDTNGVSGFRVHFGTVNHGSDIHFPSEKFDTLIPIFASTKSDGQSDKVDTGDYFIISPLSGLAKIESSVVTKWLENNGPKWRKLSQILHKEESKSLWYPIENITELYNELNCELEGHIVNGVTLFFAAYEEGTKKDGNDISKQLTVVYVFYRQSGSNKEKEYVFFEERPKSKNLDPYDTGNPCPPNTCG